MLQRKTPLRSKKQLQSKTPLRATKAWKPKRSKRAREKDFSPAVKAIVRERSNGVCEYCDRERAVEMHHARFRSSETPDLSVLSNAIHLCAKCHKMADEVREVRDRCVELAMKLAEQHERWSIG